MKNIYFVVMTLFLMGCQMINGLGSIPYWDIYTEDQARLCNSKKFNVSQEELDILCKTPAKELKGEFWSVNTRTTKKDLLTDPYVSWRPLKMEKVSQGEYTEKWTYPYAYVYFKREALANVEFREDEINNAQIPIDVRTGRFVPK